MALREHANDKGNKLYDEEYDNAMIIRENTIDSWREKNPESILTDDPRFIYRVWPADLMDQLNEIDRKAIRCGRTKCVALLREVEKKMQVLVAFWRDCGLITGQGISPSSWWQDPKVEAEQLLKPQYWKERLNAINTEFGYLTDKAEKLRMIETSCWLESTINGDSEPAVSDTLPHSLLDELDTVWQDRHWLDHDNTKDEIIAGIRRWRKSKYQQRLEEGLCTSPQLGSEIGPEEPTQMTRSSVCSGQKNLLRDSVSSSVMKSEDIFQLREKLSEGARRRLGTRITMAEDRAIWQCGLRSRANPTIAEGQTIWQDRLRPRRGAISASHERLRPVQRSTGKSKGMVKKYGRKVLEQKRQKAVEDEAIIFITQKANMSHLPDTSSHFNEASFRSTLASIARVRRTKNARR